MSADADGPAGRLPPGRLPQVGAPELIAALERRRAGRQRAVAELRAALAHLTAALEHRHARIAGLLDALGGADDRRDGP